MVSGSLFDRVRIVLVHTTHPGNIGGAARAMKNMGFSDLVLVSPAEFPSGQARARASGATDILESAQVVNSVEDAIQGCQWVVGTSARERRIPWPLLSSRECGEKALVTLNGHEHHQMAILFGREDRGLTNEELQLCHSHVTIPSNEKYSSLNLAAAVQVLCYELRMNFLPELQRASDSQTWGCDWDYPLATSDELEQMFEHLETTLKDIGFLKTDNPMQVMTRLRRLLLRSQVDKMEVGMLRGILTAVNKSRNQ